jgi:hypothetical protein
MTVANEEASVALHMLYLPHRGASARLPQLTKAHKSPGTLSGGRITIDYLSEIIPALALQEWLKLSKMTALGAHFDGTDWININYRVSSLPFDPNRESYSTAAKAIWSEWGAGEILSLYKRHRMIDSLAIRITWRAFKIWNYGRNHRKLRNIS